MSLTVTMLAFKSFLKVIRTENATNEDIAQALVDALGIYDASEIAYQINELEKTVPVQ